MNQQQIEEIIEFQNQAKEKFGSLCDFLRPFVQKHAKATYMAYLQENRISIQDVSLSNSGCDINIYWNYWYGSDDYSELTTIPVSWISMSKEELEVALNAATSLATTSVQEAKRQIFQKELKEAEQRVANAKSQLEKI